jgi:hypothetical protein
VSFPNRAPIIHGIDFTSAPRRTKPIVVASGRLRGDAFLLEEIENLPTLGAYEQWLRRPGTWVGGFDFPFGLPRTALVELGWPLDWVELTRHCRMLGRELLRTALDAHRARRPVGDKYCYRRGDAAAGSHSPLKLVNPPVALMFLEGACRFPDAGVTVPGMHAADPDRVALEAYPGHAVRNLSGGGRLSYKNDAPGKQTPERAAARQRIVHTLRQAGLAGIRLEGEARLVESLAADASGDRLDAVLCAVQAAWGWQRREARFGLPETMDPLEGWIVSVPAHAAARPLQQRGGRTD